MSKINGIWVDMHGLDDKEQLDLWYHLFNFAHHKLPDNKNLIIGIVKKDKGTSKVRLK